jgi:uncharacterized repeat protein (TIGR03803 family)
MMRTQLGTYSAAAILSLAAALVMPATAGATTFNVLHTFTGGSDGANPLAGLTVDRAGNLYGTAEYGGAGYGTAFELRHGHAGWSFDVLYTFASGNDGAAPAARLMPGPAGHLYGTASAGGGGGGTVFDLSASQKHDPRKEKSLYRFVGSGNGYQPSNGDLAFDAAGNLYGTTVDGGGNGAGTVFELSRTGNKWHETILHSFGAVGDGANPVAGVTLDASGNVYGTTSAGGSAGQGTVFALSRSGSGWSETILHSFLAADDGSVPYAGLTFDAAGNLYGAATDGGTNGGGTIFALSPGSGGWQFNVVYSVPGWGISGPFRTPVVDAAGDVFGTTHCDGAYSAGSVFELVHSGSTWTYASLHDFTGGSDGEYVFSNPVFDAHGNIYGTTQIGGSGSGVVWEVSP